MPAVVLQECLARIVLMNGDKSLPSKLRIITPDLQPYGIPDLATIEGQEIIDQYIDDETNLIILDNIHVLQVLKRMMLMIGLLYRHGSYVSVRKEEAFY